VVRSVGAEERQHIWSCPAQARSTLLHGSFSFHKVQISSRVDGAEDGHQHRQVSSIGYQLKHHTKTLGKE
jgi:hypothetical protein